MYKVFYVIEHIVLNMYNLFKYKSYVSIIIVYYTYLRSIFLYSFRFNKSIMAISLLR